MLKLNKRFKLSLIATGLFFVNQVSAQTESTIAQSQKFIQKAEQQMLNVSIKFARGHYIWDTYITRDTGRLLGEVFTNRNNAYVKLASEAKKFDRLELDGVSRRKLALIKSAFTWNTPVDPKNRQEKNKIERKIRALVANKTSCDSASISEDECLTIADIDGLMATNKQNPQQLLNLWHKGHDLAKPILPHYTALSSMINDNAQSLGFSNSLDMWRTPFDGEKINLTGELDRVWQQVEPLYSALQCHVKTKLTDLYGQAQVPQDQAIPAHLVGSLSATDLTNLLELVVPEKQQASFEENLTAKIKAQNLDALAIVHQAEKFYTSMGFEALPESFYQYSQFTQPRDRKVECGAAGWVMDFKDDIRLRMCIEPKGQHFVEVHKQMAYLFDARAHNKQSFIFNESPNEAFFTGLQDAMALSMTPDYLNSAKLAIKDNNDLNNLMKLAMEKVTALPFDLALVHWQEKIMKGEKSATDNNYWWSLREKYQGIAAPSQRSDEYFDAGLQGDVRAFQPVGISHFMATILQFQYHASLCKVSDNQGPLHTCSIYNSKKAGEKLLSTFAMGTSRPWPEVLAKLSGSRQLDGTALVNYFAPLQAYLDKQNKNNQCG